MCLSVFLGFAFLVNALLFVVVLHQQLPIFILSVVKGSGIFYYKVPKIIPCSNLAYVYGQNSLPWLRL